MTEPIRTGVVLSVWSQHTMTVHHLVTDPGWRPILAHDDLTPARFTDPAFGIDVVIHVLLSDNGYLCDGGLLTPEPDRCALCHGAHHIPVREDRADRGDWQDANINGLGGTHQIITVRKPCPACCIAAYLLSVHDESEHLR